MPDQNMTDTPTVPAHFVSLGAAKEMISRHIDAVLDQMSPSDAITLVEWLKDDATGRVIEMESTAGWPP